MNLITIDVENLLLKTLENSVSIYRNYKILSKLKYSKKKIKVELIKKYSHELIVARHKLDENIKVIREICEYLNKLKD